MIGHIIVFISFVIGMYISFTRPRKDTTFKPTFREFTGRAFFGFAITVALSLTVSYLYSHFIL